jgi:hypothetical protein
MIKMVEHHPRAPRVNDVHEAGLLLAHAMADLQHAEAEIEAVGMGLYRLVPPEPRIESEGDEKEESP